MCAVSLMLPSKIGLMCSRTTIISSSPTVSNLVEKEWEAVQQGCEFQIQALEMQIQQQGRQLELLKVQRQETP
jgi:hypothetical protein